VQTIDPTLLTALVALCVGALMVHAGVAKRSSRGGRGRTDDCAIEAADGGGRRVAPLAPSARAPARAEPGARPEANSERRASRTG
jgi:hypothetical protein